MKQSFGIISETTRILGVTAFWPVTTVLFLFPGGCSLARGRRSRRGLTGAALFRSAAATV